MGRRNVWLKFCAPGWGMEHWYRGWRERKASRQWPQTHTYTCALSYGALGRL